MMRIIWSFSDGERICTAIFHRLRGLAGLALSLIFAASAALCHAAIPQAAIDDPLYVKGYLVVTRYPGVHADGSQATSTRAGLQQAIDDSSEHRLAAYFPQGVYLIDDQLRCRTATQSNDPGEPHHVLVGATLGARPVIRLAPNSPGYNDANLPKAMLEIKNVYSNRPNAEREPGNYYQMLRGIDFDCSDRATHNTNDGAFGVYFNAAQDSSLENVRVDATGAYAGFVGLPGRAWGAVNIEVEGGQYGIDANRCAGSVVAGAVFKNQTVSAIKYHGFAPMVLVGFEIATPSNSTNAALAIEPAASLNSNCLNLIDGVIRCGGAPKVAAIDDTAGQSIYLRNVYVTVAAAGGAAADSAARHRLVKSGSQAAVTGAGTWKLIKEYCYCSQASQKLGRARKTLNLIDGVVGDAAEPIAHPVIDNSAPPPDDLALRHRWVSLPSIDDRDCVDAADYGIKPGAVSSAKFQNVIDAHRKLYLRPGRYSLDGTITLHRDSALFGAGRHLTQIAPRDDWDPTRETPIITTDDDPNATTYIGDLCIGVSVTDPKHDWFNALDWKAGANSMVHIGRPFTIPEKGGADETQPHSLLKVSHSGGGRWYFPGCGEVKGVKNSGFRTFKADRTTQPLWIYGLNPEHEMSDSYTEFAGANIRIYCVKSEDKLSNTWFKPIVTFTDATNVALFGHGAIRDGAGAGRGTLEVNGRSDRVLATLLMPQTNGHPGNTVQDNTVMPPKFVVFPDGVALFKRGEIGDDDEAIMKHAHVGYGNPGPAKTGERERPAGR